jgi:uncharacterized protein (DUF1501 family)
MARRDPYLACEDFHRTAATARHPGIGVTRRHFLGWGLGAGVALYTARSLPLQHWMEGAEEAAAAEPNARVLVCLFLPGGLDLLDTFLDSEQYGIYRDARGGAARPLEGARLAGSTIVPHPAMRRGVRGGLATLFDAGQIGLLPGIDYANPDLSHFHSRHFWETGTITPQPIAGWLGRWLDVHGGRRNPFQGLTSGPALSPTLLSTSAPVASLSDVRRAALAVPGLSGRMQARTMRAYRDLAAARRSDGTGRAAVRSSARLAQAVADRLAGIDDNAGLTLPPDAQYVSDDGTPLTGYPRGSQLGTRLRRLAHVLSQPLGTRVATVDCSGNFDTHNDQPGRLASLLGDVSSSLAAFQADLQLRGLDDRVLTFVWTEFGRRLRGNRSAGTDHGAGGVAWVMGPHAASGVLTEYPALDRLDANGNLRVTADFREVYASLIEQWLGTPAEGIIPDAGAMRRFQLVK